MIDILPTFLDVANQDIPKNMDGKSFYNVLKGDEKQIHEYLYGVSTRQNVRGTRYFHRDLLGISASSISKTLMLMSDFHII